MTVEVKDTVSPLLAALADQLGGTFTVTASVGSEDSIAKMEALKAADRDFLKPTQEMATAAVRTATRVLDAELKKARGGHFDFDRVVQAIGEGAWAHVLLRFKGGKRDVTMRSLSRAWLAKKREAGRPAAIGNGLTGDLLRDLSAATITTRRTAR